MLLLLPRETISDPEMGSCSGLCLCPPRSVADCCLRASSIPELFSPPCHLVLLQILDPHVLPQYLRVAPCGKWQRGTNSDIKSDRTQNRNIQDPCKMELAGHAMYVGILPLPSDPEAHREIKHRGSLTDPVFGFGFCVPWICKTTSFLGIVFASRESEKRPCFRCHFPSQFWRSISVFL